MVEVVLINIASIEHQIEIHVVDLVEAIDNTDITVLDILQGLKYVFDYRLASGKLPHLDAELMAKLCKGLLEQTHHKKGNLINQRPTEEADLAFSLFGDFIASVSEFRMAVGTYSASDLRHRLKIHRRCQPRSTEEQKIAAASLLGLLTLRFPQFSDWHELVNEDEHDDIEKLMAQYPEKFHTPAMPSADTVFPPPALYFDKNAEALAAMYGSNTSTGLKEENIARLREHYGINQLPAPPKASLLKMLWGQLSDFMVIILTIVAAVNLGTQHYNEAVVLIIVVVINVTIGVTQEVKANKALEALLTLTVAQASVIRDGNQKSLIQPT